MMLWLIFCNNNIICYEISEMKYLTKHMHENDMWFSYQSHSRITNFYDSDSNSIPLGLIPILIPIPVFLKNLDSDSDSDSSIT
mgnify:CR=1 FL=1